MCRDIHVRARLYDYDSTKVETGTTLTTLCVCKLKRMVDAGPGVAELYPNKMFSLPADHANI